MIAKRSWCARVSIATGLVILFLGLAAFRFAGELLLVAVPFEPPDVIVVLASHEWERLPLAAALAKRYPAARVLLTRPAEITDHNCFECAGRVGRLADAGIHRERVTVLPNRVTNTYDEAKAVRSFAKRHPVVRLMIVTSPYHGRRALATFRHVFRTAGMQTRIGLASPSAGIQPARWWFRHYDREYVAYEWAGIIYYAIRFRVPPAV